MLMAEGHQYANNYPLSKLWIEAEIAKERINAKMVTETVLLQAVVASAFNKAGSDELQKLMDDLNYG